MENATVRGRLVQHRGREALDASPGSAIERSKLASREENGDWEVISIHKIFYQLINY